ncbi:hypothetical protein BH708_13355 [Brachybacterium sp. P6-10-X1]|uniref:methyltransferase domain-containing protein n=1 Tax=Brachybacterium sp. P6-10-X1 TaxID=1903186 RepID=UPI0009719343|nr:methyltransferase domain-containing protein [Brachybacterium sp. P6-10-X1]APX33534.1 hypothetical protein BH708_13355 [Brachybacterium sp. P6-10-X1]
MTLSDAFTRSARRYDLLTGLNPGYRRELREAAEDLAAGIGRGRDHDAGPPPRIWDLGCGSGLSTRALLRAMPTARVTGLDASAGMLARARIKSWPSTTHFVTGDVEELSTHPEPALQEQPNGIFAAYLFRNLAPDARDAALAHISTRLRPGGRLVVHDYSVRESLRARVVWSLVCWLIVIPLSRIVGADPGLYRYLWHSVRDNDSTARFRRRLLEAGFEEVAVRTGRGWHRGILHTYTARAPGGPDED